MSDSSTLQEIRDGIDALDAQIQRLINERAAKAQEVARVKQGGGDADSFYRPEREAAVLRKVVARNQGPLSDEEIARLFREIMSACLSLQQPMKIAYLGPEGTFTESAAFKHFGRSVDTRSSATIDEVFRDVESRAAHYGVVPIENSAEGVVRHTLDMFINSPLKVCGEVELRIHHHLLSKLDNIATIKRVYAHQQALAQCSDWLATHLEAAEHYFVSSNAEAARRSAQEEGAAAIAGAPAAELYGLKVLASNIEDEPDNTTRFLVIGHRTPPPSGNDKTSLLLSASNRPGALHRLLDPLMRHGISMSRIESRPSRRGMWEYVFFVDIDGHAQDVKVAEALTALNDEAAMLKILGSYPKAIL
jgi:chorismate mutase/prephenate dehydratase